MQVRRRRRDFTLLSFAGLQQRLTHFHLATGAILVVAAIAVVIASLRVTDRAIDEAVAQRQAVSRFVQEELSVLRIMAMTSRSPVPGRLYLGIEECLLRSLALPFDGNDAAARRTVTACAQTELGRLHAQGGGAMADEGRTVLEQSALLQN